MGLKEAVSTVFRKYAVFNGRAMRSEFWYWTLFTWVVSVVVSLVEPPTQSGFQFITLLFALGTLVPSIAVSVRRLHDLNRSGWWLLVFFIPLLGIVLLVVWFIGRGTVGGNRYGPDPLAGVPA